MGRRAAETVVIGAGPAGAAAAIQLKRGGFEPLLFEGDRIGGLLREAHLIENYPGFPDGIAGDALADLIAAHLSGARIDVAPEEVVLLDRVEDLFAVRTSSREVSAATVVIASGTEPKRAEGVRISEAARRRVHYGVKDLERMRGATVAVVGGGDAAHDYALTMARENDVIILHRSGRQRCIPALRERCRKAARVSYRPNTAVEEISEAPGGVVLRCRVSRAGGGGEGAVEIRADAVLVAVGRVPRLGFLGSGLVAELDNLRKSGRLYLAGDVAGGDFRQAAISAGGGLLAAMEIRRRHEGSDENGKG